MANYRAIEEAAESAEDFLTNFAIDPSFVVMSPQDYSQMVHGMMWSNPAMLMPVRAPIHGNPIIVTVPDFIGPPIVTGDPQFELMNQIRRRPVQA